MAGCGQEEQSGTGAVTSVATAGVETEIAMPEATEPTEESGPEETSSDTLGLTPTPALAHLVWWASPHFSPEDETEAGQLVADALAVFEEANPTLEVQTILKAPHGKGGLLDFLLTTQKAAPALLPDLVSLEGDDLLVAQRAGLLQPLDGLLSEELINDLYPFATAMGRLDGKLYAVQFDADIEHVGIDTTMVPSPPRTWTDVLTLDRPYLFPVGAENNPSDAFLIHYMSAGGEIGERNAPFVLDEMALLRVLEFYEQGRQEGVIPTTALGMDSAEETWPLLTSNRVDVAHVLASRYLQEREQNPGIDFGPTPVAGDQPATISRGWTLAITATDPERQAAALRLLETLVAARLNGEWSQAAQRLPTRRTALDLWDQEDLYVSFLRWQLESAAIHPSGASYLEAARILAQAQRDVLGGSLTAREATERATGVELP